MAKHIQTICRQYPSNCLSVFDQFMGLVFKWLKAILSSLKLSHLLKYLLFMLNLSFITYKNKHKFNGSSEIGWL